MKNASLATAYRPQSFAEVAGQELIVKVLSRSAAQDKIAPAYLLSGTRGVGKTTIARIFAKALNCIHAPQAEPCNKCEQCKKITQGNHVDVHEIDGASNNSVEDARAMRENIGYAPMDGRYKVFIIDEAHMLSRSAFNAMLKTLEEPPPRVVFIFATTEAHKFPITIVSRCQHFVLKRLNESQIIVHLTSILQKEQAEFEPEAIRLISQRACGSVRDGMSLLGQSLALGSDVLSAKSVRSILGMTSLDIYNKLFDAIIEQNCLDIINLLRQMLDEGIDIGFFLREFSALWRTLFLLRQDGNKIIPSLNLSEDEASLWLGQAQRFSLTHIHAAWHMVLESQRRISQSPEPSSDLELLLLNISLMPKLLPLEKIKNSDEFYPQGLEIKQNSDATHKIELSEPEIYLKNTGEKDSNSNDLGAIHASELNSIDTENLNIPYDNELNIIDDNELNIIDDNELNIIDDNELNIIHAEDLNIIAAEDLQAMAGNEPNPQQLGNNLTVQNKYNPKQENYIPTQIPHAPIQAMDDEQGFDYADEDEQFINHNSFYDEDHSPIQFNWENLCKFICQQKNADIKQIALKQAHGTFDKNTLCLQTKSITVYNALCDMREQIHKLAESFYKNTIEIVIPLPQHTTKTKKELIAEAETYIEVKNLKEIFDACIEDCQPYMGTQQNNRIKSD